MTIEDPNYESDLATWLDAPVNGNNLPPGSTNGSVLANSAGWQAATTTTAQTNFLSTYSFFSSFWQRLQELADQGRKAALIALSVSMILDWIARKVQGHED